MSEKEKAEKAAAEVVKVVAGKARYWCAVMYPENMLENWQEIIGDKLGLPYCYCVHDKDHLAEYKAGIEAEGHDSRKLHVHIIIAFPNTTTYKTAYNTFQRLAIPGRKALPWCEAVNTIRNKYEYLIHNTETAKKQKKFQYSPKERICGNNFDIGNFEQVSQAEKDEMALELVKLILEKEFVNFAEFVSYVLCNFDKEYFGVIKTNSGLFERLCKGNYQKFVCMFLQKHPEILSKERKNEEKAHENEEKTHEFCCPECGSEHVVKNGKTQAGSSRWRCKACGKSFV